MAKNGHKWPKMAKNGQPNDFLVTLAGTSSITSQQQHIWHFARGCLIKADYSVYICMYYMYVASKKHFVSNLFCLLSP